jgi:hypothetical protein
VFAAVWVARYGGGTGLATLLPVVAWFYTLYRLTSVTSGGDLVVPGTWVGYGLFLAGIASVFAAIFYLVIRPGGVGARTELSKPAQRSRGKR